MLQSPNNFRLFGTTSENQTDVLREAFEVLHESFFLVEKKLKDEYLASLLRELLKMAYEFLSTGDERNGRYALQEIEGTIWQSRRIPPRHAPEAEFRAHGKLERYAGVVPHPYPYKGNVGDMRQHQLQLLNSVLKAYEGGKEVLAPGNEHYWLLGADSVARRFSVRSKKAATSRFTQELSAGSSTAALCATSIYGDLLIFDVEELGSPRISIRGKRETFISGDPNYIVEESLWTAQT